MTSEATIVGIGQSVGRGTIISMILVLFVLPQILLLGEGLIKKTTVSFKSLIDKEGIKGLVCLLLCAGMVLTVPVISQAQTNTAVRTNHNIIEISTEDDLEKLSNCIANGFDDYYNDLVSEKKKVEAKKTEAKTESQTGSKTEAKTETKPESTATSSTASESQTSNQATAEASPIVFKVQFLSSSTRLPANSPKLKGMPDVDCYEEKGVFKYTCGNSTDLAEIQKLKKTVCTTYKDAFIIAFRDGKRINTTDAVNEYKATHQ